MKTFYHFLAFGLLSSMLFFNTSFANVANQPLLPITELFTNASYAKFLSRYHISTARATELLSNEDILQLLSYLHTISVDEEEFFQIIDLLVLSYPIEQRPENSKEMISMIDKAFGWSYYAPSSTASTDQLNLITNTSSVSLDQWMPLLILVDTSYRGWVDFTVEWRETTNNQRTQVTSATYFTANSALEEGVQFTTQDHGQIAFAEFIRFKKSWWYKLSAESEDGNTTFLTFDVELSTTSSPSTSSSSPTLRNEKVLSEYTYRATNCKTYSIQRLENNRYSSPNFQYPMYFITPAYIERYIDSKNPGTCEIRTTYATNEIIRNTSTDEHITPNGKIYDIEKEGNRYFSPQMEVRKHFTDINLLRQYLTEKNPLSTLRTYNKIEHQETYTATVSYQKTFTIYQTDKGRMSDALSAETYFATAQELKTYINQHLR